MFRKLLSIIFAMIVTIVAPVCHATPINGEVLFASIDWSKTGSTLSVINPQIVIATDDFTGMTNLVINDLQYNTFVALDPLWETDQFKFAISSLTIVSETTGPDSLVLSGGGTIYDKTGPLEATSGSWNFSGGNFNWSAHTAASASVSAPAVLSIMGIGLFGICFSTKRRQST